jgi:exodeoxyribonuclease V beta subunit
LLEDTGLLFSPLGKAADAEAERRLQTLRHLVATVEQVGHGSNFDLVGMLEWIERQRQQREPADGEGPQVETGRPKVKIMTIHAAKGLEFPIVFLAGGFTQGLTAGAATVYRDERRRLVFDLCPDNAARERVNAERLSEQRRLLYVAMTRAIFKLYIPKIRVPRRGSQYLGPLGTILAPALDKACPENSSGLVADCVAPALTLGAAGASTAAAPTADAAARPFHLDGPLFPALDPALGKRRIVTRSFSSMTRHHLSQVGEGSSFGEQKAPADDEAAAPLDREDPLRGPVFGDMVHRVLEAIDFAEVARAASAAELVQAGTHARKLIDQQIKADLPLLRTRTPIAQLEEACRQQVAGLVWNALRTPLAEVGPLCAIAPAERAAEIEFLYPEHNDAALEERFITGYMDLLFRKAAKFYLVDWKTNLLPGYGRNDIERSMIDADYHRQYRLYLQAVERWLRRVHGGDVPFRDRFGGVYYLYVRGMNGRDDSSGVYFHRPTPQDLDLEQVLK